MINQFHGTQELICSMMGLIFSKAYLFMPSGSDPNNDDDQIPGFMESLEGIRKLEHDRVDLYHDRPKKSVRIHKHPVDNPKPNLQPSHQDVVSSQASWFQHGIQRKLQQRIQRGHLPIEAELDLHGYRQHEALPALQEFIDHALKNGLRFAIIIHGKGFRSQTQSVLRPLVQNWLHDHPAVLAYCPAQPKDGGKGASYVYLQSC